jgi:outer membrane protein TolC
MKECAIKILFIVVIISSVFVSNGQNSFDAIDDELNVYNLKNQILPLEQLLDSCEVYSPLLKMVDADIYIQDLRIKSEKKEWLTFFSISGTAKYGMFDNLVINEDSGEDYLGSTSTKQSRYSVGMTLKVPLSSIFDKVNRDVAKSEKVKLQHQRDNTIKELRKLVIAQYANLIRAHTKLIIRTSELETVKLQMMDVELNYKNGKIPLSAFTSQKGELLNIKLALEEIKIEFTVALYNLQETIGINLNINPTI